MEHSILCSSIGWSNHGVARIVPGGVSRCDRTSSVVLARGSTNEGAYTISAMLSTDVASSCCVILCHSTTIPCYEEYWVKR